MKNNGPDHTQPGPDRTSSGPGPQAPDNQPLIDAITEAHNALSRAIAFFQQTAKENRNGL